MKISNNGYINYMRKRLKRIMNKIILAGELLMNLILWNLTEKNGHLLNKFAVGL